jgi:D-sedoheptulose 7-phosphate isomerase
MKESSAAYLEELCERYPQLSTCHTSLYSALDMMIDTYQRGNKVLVCGNGGSAADSLHIVGELMKGFVLPRRLSDIQQAKLRQAVPEMAEYCVKNLQGALPAISLVSETGLSTAYANDQAPDLCFAQQVMGNGKEGDILIGISTSGNSANVIYAAGVARAFGIKVIGLTGFGGGKLKPYCDVLIDVPEKATYKIQEFHLPIYHALCLAIESEMFGN